MRVMGVDPGLTRCGLSLVEGGVGRAVVALDVDVVRTPSDLDLAERLMLIANAAEYWMDTHRPDAVAVERVFSQANVRTAMGTAQAGGVVALAAARRGITVVFHTPSQVKSAVTGNGKADKAQVALSAYNNATPVGTTGGDPGPGSARGMGSYDGRTPAGVSGTGAAAGPTPPARVRDLPAQYSPPAKTTPPPPAE